MDDSRQDQPESIRKRLQALRSRVEENRNLLRASVQSGDLYHSDFVFYAALYRSLSLLDGFIVLTEQRNAVCTGAIVRLQLDNLLRAFATTLAEPAKIYECLAKGEPLSRIRGYDGKQLRDAYLHEQLSRHLPWVSRVYERTSGFVHLSDVHFFAPIVGMDDTGAGTITMHYNWSGVEWREDEMLEAVECFDAITEALFGLYAQFLLEKPSGPR